MDIRILLQHEPDNLDIMITVEVGYNFLDGMYALPVKYSVSENQWETIGENPIRKQMDMLVEAIIEDDFDGARLTEILYDNEAFSPALKHMAEERSSDVSWIQSRQL